MDRPAIEQLLARPVEQRLREYRYRCAQAIVFGLPVILLHYCGHLLGGPEAARWSNLFQALLAGWVMYVGAAGMLFEGVLVLPRRVTGDFLVACAALALYLVSLVCTACLLLTGKLLVPSMFHLSVLLVMLWTGWRWAGGACGPCLHAGATHTLPPERQR
jgi:cation transport ATPase